MSLVGGERDGGGLASWFNRLSEHMRSGDWLPGASDVLTYAQ